MANEDSGLIKYGAGSIALIERMLGSAKTVEEVKHIHNAAISMAGFAKRAKDREAEAKCAEIRERAERRLGQMLEAGKKDRAKEGGYRRNDGLSKNPSSEPTLAELDVDKNLAHRSRTAAKKSPEQFETDVKEKTDKIIHGRTAVDTAKEQIKSPTQSRAARTVVKPPTPPTHLPGPVTQPTALANFKYATDHWLPMLNADDLNNARAHFQDRADACEKAIAARPTGSAEQSAEERRALNAKLLDEITAPIAKQISKALR
jgi:hypothetical protein